MFWVSGFGERPEERGGISSVEYSQNLAYSGWFRQIALPSFKEKVKVRHSQTGEGTQNPEN